MAREPTPTIRSVILVVLRQFLVQESSVSVGQADSAAGSDSPLFLAEALVATGAIIRLD